MTARPRFWNRLALGTLILLMVSAAFTTVAASSAAARSLSQPTATGSP